MDRFLRIKRSCSLDKYCCPCRRLLRCLLPTNFVDMTIIVHFPISLSPAQSTERKERKQPRPSFSFLVPHAFQGTSPCLPTFLTIIQRARERHRARRQAREQRMLATASVASWMACVCPTEARLARGSACLVGFCTASSRPTDPVKEGGHGSP